MKARAWIARCYGCKVFLKRISIGKMIHLINKITNTSGIQKYLSQCRERSYYFATGETFIAMVREQISNSPNLKQLIKQATTDVR